MIEPPTKALEGWATWEPYGPLYAGVTNWTDDDGITPIDDAMSSVKRLREGAERFLITDINNPAASAQGQSEIIMMYDAWGGGKAGDGSAVAGNGGFSIYNHIPGGSNVLFMDGHVSWVKQNGGPPMLSGVPTGPNAPVSYLQVMFNYYYLGGWG